jgi:hypothetical protein
MSNLLEYKNTTQNYKTIENYNFIKTKIEIFNGFIKSSIDIGKIC